jgi:hypothetical protein
MTSQHTHPDQHSRPHPHSHLIAELTLLADRAYSDWVAAANEFPGEFFREKRAPFEETWRGAEDRLERARVGVGEVEREGARDETIY